MSHAPPIGKACERHDPCADSSHRAIVTQLIDTIGGNASAWALTQNTVRTAVMGLVEAVYTDAKANLTLAKSQFAPETGSEGRTFWSRWRPSVEEAGEAKGDATTSKT